jgi:hypothetical protein
VIVIIPTANWSWIPTNHCMLLSWVQDLASFRTSCWKRWRRCKQSVNFHSRKSSLWWLISLRKISSFGKITLL